MSSTRADDPPYWEEMWSQGIGRGEKFDTGKVSRALQKLLDNGVLPKGRSLEPGCGRGYNTIAFAKNGYDAIGLDVAASGIKEAKVVLASEQEPLSGKAEFQTGDFFAFTAEEQGKFDVVLDYTFLCALDPSVRDAWADHMISLLAPGGELVTIIFPIVDKVGGPPYAMSESLVSGLLKTRGLEPIQLEELPPSLCDAGREGKTSLGRWRFPSAS